MKYKRLFPLLLTFSLAIPLTSAFAAEITTTEISPSQPVAASEESAPVTTSTMTSDACGENVYWMFDGSCLTIYGTGEMDTDYGNWWHSYGYDTEITTVIIEEGVTNVVNSAFWGCNNLSSVLLPEGLTTIEDYAFMNCSSLASITLPDSVISIGKESFSGCSSLKSIELSSGMKTIGDIAFSGCSSLKSVEIPNGVTTIGYGAFSNCTSLTDVSFTSSVSSLGSYAFGGSSSAVARVTFYGSEEEFESLTRYKDTLTNATVTYQKNIYQCGKTAFWRYDDSTATLTITGTGEMYDKYDYDDYTIPWDTYKYTAKNLIISDGITHIGAYSFDSFYSLSKIDIPEGVTSIGDCAFRGCYSAKITLPSTLETINMSAFESCNNLTDITLPNGLTFIGSNAFQGCYELREITIPATVTMINSRTFASCFYLETVNLPDTLTTIDSGAFYDCCDALESIDIPFSVTSIAGDAFASCQKLTSINVDSHSSTYCSVDGILLSKDGTKLIVYPAGLKEVSLPEGVTTIGTGAFSGFSKYTSIALPDGIISAEASAFDDLSYVTEITLPSTLKTISSKMFDSCNFADMHIPNTVETMEANAFYYCSDLDNLYFCGETPPATPASKVNNTGTLNIYWRGEKYADKASAWETAFPASMYTLTTWTEAEHEAASTGEKVIAPTCTEQGYSYRVCTYCGDVGTTPFNYTDMTPHSCTEEIAEEKYLAGVWSCTEDNTYYKSCSACGYIGTETFTAPAPGHVEETIPAVEETETASGWTEGKKCSICGEILVAPTEIPAKNNSCGKNLDWTLESGVLTISGSGNMYDYSTADNLPWADRLSEITAVVVSDGVSNIGKNAFCGCSNVTSVSFLGDITSIGENAFNGCSALANVRTDGSKADWQTISIADGNDILSDVKIYTETVSNFGGSSSYDVTIDTRVMYARDELPGFDGLITSDLPQLQLELEDCTFKSGENGYKAELTVILEGAEFISADGSAATSNTAASLFSYIPVDGDAVRVDPAFVPYGYDGWIDTNGNSICDGGDILLETTVDETEITYNILTSTALEEESIFCIDLQTKLNKTTLDSTATVSVDGDWGSVADIVFCSIMEPRIELNAKCISIPSEEISTLGRLELEKSHNGFKGSDSITLTLTNGFEFANISPSFLLNKVEFTPAEVYIDKNVLTFTLPADFSGTAIWIEDIQIEAVSAKLGDIASITAKMDGIDSVTAEVAEVMEATVILSVDENEDIPVFYSGTDSNNSGLTNDNTHWALTATLTETLPGSWDTTQTYTLTLPDGIVVTDAKVTDGNGTLDLDTIFAEAYTDGEWRSFLIDIPNTTDETHEFSIKLQLAAKPGFAGDVTLTFSGGNQDPQSVTIASVQKPYTVTSKPVSAEINNTGKATDITITEAEPGLWEKNSTFRFAIDGSANAVFADNIGTLSVNSSSEMEVKALASGAGFTVVEESDGTPASVTLTGYEVTTSDTTGTYDLLLTTSAAEAFQNQTFYAGGGLTIGEQLELDSNDIAAEDWIAVTHTVWTLTDGVLTILDAEALQSTGADAPWYADRESITSIVITEGITAIPKNSLTDCTNATKVTLPSTVESIGNGSFSGCTALTEIHYNGTESEWAENVVYGATFPTDLLTFEREVFQLTYGNLAKLLVDELVTETIDTTGWENPFRFVTEDDPYYHDMLIAYSMRWIDENAEPSVYLLRWRLAEILCKADQGGEPTTTPPADVSSTNSYYNDICTILGSGVMSLSEEGTFEPSYYAWSSDINYDALKPFRIDTASKVLDLSEGSIEIKSTPLYVSYTQNGTEYRNTGNVLVKQSTAKTANTITITADNEYAKPVNLSIADLNIVNTEDCSLVIENSACVNLTLINDNTVQTIIADTNDDDNHMLTINGSGRLIIASGLLDIQGYNTINSGTIIATEGIHFRHNLIINGGTITAAEDGLWGDTITINGGTITVNAYGGIIGDRVTINGGIVTVTSEDSPAIGGNNSVVTINGNAKVIATGYKNAIGGNNTNNANGCEAITIADTADVTLKYTYKNGTECIEIIHIDDQPLSSAALLGNSAAISITAHGHSGLSYQWESSPDGETWTVVKGQTTATLTTPVTEETNGHYYRCSLTNGWKNTIYSDSAQAFVLNFAQQPRKQDTGLSDLAALSVKASCEDVTFQWQQSTDDGKTWTDISGGNASVLDINLNTAEETTLYRCVLTATNGDQLISDSVTLANANDITYTIKYYQEKADGSGYYEVADQETIIAAEGTAVSIPEKTYEHFTEVAGKGITSGIVAADSSLELTRYYDRTEYAISFDTNGGTILSDLKAKYNTVITLPQAAKYAMEFGGWYTDADCTEPFTATKMPGENITLYAKWILMGADRGTEYHFNGIRVASSENDYTSLDTLPKGTFYAEVSVTNEQSKYMDTLMLPSYAGRQMVSLQYMSATSTIGQTVIFGTTIDNTDGEITTLKAFMVPILNGQVPLAIPATFGQTL